MKDTLISIKAKLSAISLKSHRNGYDFNADPEKITLLEGEIFEALDKLIASQPNAQAVRFCDNCGALISDCTCCLGSAIRENRTA